MKLRSTITIAVFIGVTIPVYYVYKIKVVERISNFSTYDGPADKPIRSIDKAYQGQDTPVRKISASYPEDMTSDLTFDPSILGGPMKDTALKTVMDERISYLREQCQATGANNVKADAKWMQEILLTKPGLFKVCAIPKGGRTSWKTLMMQIPEDVLGRNPLLHILNVRNPLARLASAYRDKFLGGLPLYKYDDEWRAKISFFRKWDEQWVNFWYGALVSRGSIPTRTIPLRANNALNGVKIDLRKSTYNFLQNFSLGPDSKYKSEFRNTTFTFEDFLRYVVWTYEIGYMNKHWAPVLLSCNPCHYRYDFIAHLETISPEVTYIMKFLNHTEGIRIEENHKTKTVKSSDILLYENIPYDLLKRILDIYKYDFELYGYRYPFD